MPRDAGPGREGEYELPDGVIPLRPPEREERAGCTVTGCLYAAAVLFALALVALVIGLVVRVWVTPPVPRL